MIPRVTVMISTKDRPRELRLTLLEMRKQEYPAMDLLVIDDGSFDPVEPVVREIWPGGKVVRHDSSAGQCVRRNEGFRLCESEYVLQLDDDCSFIGPSGLATAVARIEAVPEAGALAFYLLNSPALTEPFDTTGVASGYVAAFVGAAVLFRRKALNQTRGYRPFFRSEWEEEELGLQLLRRDWRILFVPEVVAHHRLSNVNRNSAGTWSRGLRNRMWAMLIHMPLKRLPLETAWKLGIGMWDAFRLLRFGHFSRSLVEYCRGIAQAWRLRDPLSPQALKRYDALRLCPVLSREEFENPPTLTPETLAAFFRRWRNRARNRNFWASEDRDTGSSYTVGFAHEIPAKRVD